MLWVEYLPSVSGINPPFRRRMISCSAIWMEVLLLPVSSARSLKRWLLLQMSMNAGANTLFHMHSGIFMLPLVFNTELPVLLLLAVSGIWWSFLLLAVTQPRSQHRPGICKRKLTQNPKRFNLRCSTSLIGNIRIQARRLESNVTTNFKLIPTQWHLLQNSSDP